MKKRKSLLRIILNILLSVAVFILVALALIYSIFAIKHTSLQVRGFSMQPTINSGVTDINENGDIVFINKYDSFAVNDIVVCNVDWTNTEKDSVIKRLVGCPGDKIKVKEEDDKYILYTNNQIIYTREKTSVSAHKSGGTIYFYEHIYTDFITNPTYANNITTDEVGDTCIILHDDEYFIVGDNWSESSDSFSHGPISKDKIVGRVDVVIPVGSSYYPTLFVEVLKYTFGIN